ncbi:MAG: RluA family pseudouridine synthase [Bacteroidetes bacterium]|nr:RluA family pseudouridine synthase [Bacteroidota bacterium]MCW5895770.1 RluA family pseudouridine synthase [Bacteroidota bacterium]
MPTEIEIIVPSGKKKERLDVFLTHHVENATRNKVQRAIEQRMVLVNGKAVRPSHQVAPGEKIHVILPKPLPQKALPENIPLDILFEDDELLVVNKPAGMVTHPAHGNYTGTLVNALLFYCNQLSTVNDATRPGIVHRLDKDTSGLMVVAKTDAAHANLAKQFSARTVQREYWALVWGSFKERRGIIEASLGRSKSDRKKIAVVANGKHAVTEYEVVERFDYLSLIRLKLRTGRTHQIRVHLAHINHPVFGDPTYSGRRIVAGSGSFEQKTEVQQLLRLILRQSLHAKTLGFVHPKTQTEIFFDSDLPADFSSILARLRAH